MPITNFRNTVFYSIERAIKGYRRFAVLNLQQYQDDITINQALLLSLITENPGVSQVEMSDILFKDYAAVTRMIELLVKRGYLERAPHATDRRRSQLLVTESGKKTVTKLSPVIQKNREVALSGLTESEVEKLHFLLNKIIENCKAPSHE